MAQETVERKNSVGRKMLNLFGKRDQPVERAKRLAGPELDMLNESLLYANWNGHLDELKRLIKAGADVNAKDADGFTVLMRAAKWGQTSVCKFLMNNGADPGIKDAFGKTAAMWAEQKGYAKTAEFLNKKMKS